MQKNLIMRDFIKIRKFIIHYSYLFLYNKIHFFFIIQYNIIIPKILFKTEHFNVIIFVKRSLFL